MTPNGRDAVIPRGLRRWPPQRLRLAQAVAKTPVEGFHELGRGETQRARPPSLRIRVDFPQSWTNLKGDHRAPALDAPGTSSRLWSVASTASCFHRRPAPATCRASPRTRHIRPALRPGRGRLFDVLLGRPPSLQVPTVARPYSSPSSVVCDRPTPHLCACWTSGSCPSLAVPPR
jgi:hypothetical protein